MKQLRATSNLVVLCHVTFNDHTIDFPVRPLSGVQPSQARSTCNGPYLQTHQSKKTSCAILHTVVLLLNNSTSYFHYFSGYNFIYLREA
jgi:hypothetical protein